MPKALDIGPNIVDTSHVFDFKGAIPNPKKVNALLI